MSHRPSWRRWLRLRVKLLGHGIVIVTQLTQGLYLGAVACSWRTSKHQERGWSMTEQLPEDLTEADVADRLEVDRPQDEGDTASKGDNGGAAR